MIDRLKQYLDSRNITARSFEQACRLSNGYLKNQLKGKGALGAEVLEKIHAAYEDLSLVWLFTGRGRMTLEYGSQELQEEIAQYSGGREELIRTLRDHIAVLAAAAADKDKIIALLETQGSGGRVA